MICTTLNKIRLCGCGCGGLAPICQRNNSRLGHIKGLPLTYISGHNKRGTTRLNRYVISNNGCWIWQGPLNRKGYGRAQVNGVHMNAHRAVWLASGLKLENHLHLDHLCLDKRCVNPGHMEPVTNSENVKRQWARYRAAQEQELRRILS